MSQLNTTGNKFYETVNFYKGNNAKGLLLPAESGKVDLGSSSKKFDNVYANNISGGSARIMEGTWSPQLQWSSHNTSMVTPTFSTPTTTVLAATYRKIGKEVHLVYVLRVDRPPADPGYIAYGYIKNLPFPFYQRVPFVNNYRASLTEGSPINIYHYSSHGSDPLANWFHDYLGTRGYSLTKRAIGRFYGSSFAYIFYSDSSYSQRYHYGSFSYMTQN